MHIGLIGGIGPASTGLYYRNLVRAHTSTEHKMELTIVHADLRDLMQNIANNAPDKQALVFFHLVERLQAAGVEAAALTSIAAHFCIEELQRLSQIRIISAIPELEAELVRRKLRRVGLMGTRIVMHSRLYRGIPSVEVVLPQGESFETTHNEYLAMADAGYATDRQRELLFSIGRDLCERQGAEAVVLGGTDLFLAFEGYVCGFPVIDCAGVHIDALYRESIRRG